MCVLDCAIINILKMNINKKNLNILAKSSDNVKYIEKNIIPAKTLLFPYKPLYPDPSYEGINDEKINREIIK